MRTGHSGAKRSKYTPPIEHELTILGGHKLGGRRFLSLAQCPRWGDCRHQQSTTKKNLRQECEVHSKTGAGDKTQRDATGTLRPIGDISMVVCVLYQTDSCHCRDRRTTGRLSVKSTVTPKHDKKHGLKIENTIIILHKGKKTRSAEMSNPKFLRLKEKLVSPILHKIIRTLTLVHGK
jgi:hypothetical protein